MRVLLDEDTPIQLLQVLRHILPRHSVEHLTQLHWSGKKDHAVLADARSRGYDVFLTNDCAQLDDPDETDAIKRAKIHPVRYGQRHPGMEGLGLALGAVIAAMPSIMVSLGNADRQQLVRVAGIDPRRRFDMVDPVVDPPRYWR